jgi:hypothetical protein
MGHRVFLERLTFGAITRACVEAVGAEPGIEHDRAIAFALRPALAAGEKPRADAFKPPIAYDRHLPELHRLAVKRLHRNRSDQAPREVAQKCRRRASSASSSGVNESPSGARKIASRKATARR